MSARIVLRKILQHVGMNSEDSPVAIAETWKIREAIKTTIMMNLDNISWKVILK